MNLENQTLKAIQTTYIALKHQLEWKQTLILNHR